MTDKATSVLAKLKNKAKTSEISYQQCLQLFMQKRWRYFLKNIKDDTLEFAVVIKEMQIFLDLVVDAIVDEEEWKKNWTFKQKWNGGCR